MLMELKVGKIFMTQLLMFQELQLLYRQQVEQSQPVEILKFILLPQDGNFVVTQGINMLLIIMFLTWLLQVVGSVELHLVVIMAVVAVEVLEKENSTSTIYRKSFKSLFRFSSFYTQTYPISVGAGGAGGTCKSSFWC